MRSAFRWGSLFLVPTTDLTLRRIPASDFCPVGAALRALREWNRSAPGFCRRAQLAIPTLVCAGARTFVTCQDCPRARALERRRCRPAPAHGGDFGLETDAVRTLCAHARGRPGSRRKIIRGGHVLAGSKRRGARGRLWPKAGRQASARRRERSFHCQLMSPAAKVEASSKLVPVEQASYRRRYEREARASRSARGNLYSRAGVSRALGRVGRTLSSGLGRAWEKWPGRFSSLIKRRFVDGVATSRRPGFASFRGTIA